MANLLKVKRNRIEKKYLKLIDETIKRMGNNTMQELFAEFDKLKIQMKEDFDKAGIVLDETE